MDISDSEKEQLDNYIKAKEFEGMNMRNYLVVFIGPRKYELYERKKEGYIQIIGEK